MLLGRGQWERDKGRGQWETSTPMFIRAHTLVFGMTAPLAALRMFPGSAYVIEQFFAGVFGYYIACNEAKKYETPGKRDSCKTKLTSAP